MLKSAFKCLKMNNTIHFLHAFKRLFFREALKNRLFFAYIVIVGNLSMLS